MHIPILQSHQKSKFISNFRLLMVPSGIFVYIQPLRHGPYETQGSFLSELLLVWIRSFPSTCLIA